MCEVPFHGERIQAARVARAAAHLVAFAGGTPYGFGILLSSLKDLAATSALPDKISAVAFMEDWLNVLQLVKESWICADHGED